MTQAEKCQYCQDRQDAGLGRCAVHVDAGPEPTPSAEPVVTVRPTTYTARRVIDIAGGSESLATERLALEAAREAGVPDDARKTVFATSRVASFSFIWTVGEVPR